jgi:hypothetical protein
MMTKSQLKKIRRHKAIVKRHNVRTNNDKYNPPLFAVGRSRSYRLYNI